MKQFTPLILILLAVTVYLVARSGRFGIAPLGAPQTIGQKVDVEGLNLGDSKVVLLKFGAHWCPPCRMVDKELVKLGRSDLPVNVQTIDVDDRPELAKRFEVTSIPRLILLEQDTIIGDLVGYRSAEDLTDWITESASGPALAEKKSDSEPSVVHSNPYAE